MFIVPMSGGAPVQSITKPAPKVEDTKSDASFADIFKNAIENVESTNRVCEEDSLKVALGEIDDLHTVQINLTKAKTALDVLVSMKNTAIDSYKEIMQMNV